MRETIILGAPSSPPLWQCAVPAMLIKTLRLLLRGNLLAATTNFFTPKSYRWLLPQKEYAALSLHAQFHMLSHQPIGSNQTGSKRPHQHVSNTCSACVLVRYTQRLQNMSINVGIRTAASHCCRCWRGRTGIWRECKVLRGRLEQGIRAQRTCSTARRTWRLLSPDEQTAQICMHVLAETSAIIALESFFVKGLLRSGHRHRNS